MKIAIIFYFLFSSIYLICQNEKENEQATLFVVQFEEVDKDIDEIKINIIQIYSTWPFIIGLLGSIPVSDVYLNLGS